MQAAGSVTKVVLLVFLPDGGVCTLPRYNVFFEEYQPQRKYRDNTVDDPDFFVFLSSIIVLKQEQLLPMPAFTNVTQSFFTIKKKAMPITGNGWEFLITRKTEQKRKSDGKRRTVGTYQVFHNGVKQTGAGLSGTVAETRGLGANKPAGNNRRIEVGRYPLFTQAGTNYVTIGFKDSESPTAKPKPGIELKKTGQRSEILIHPGRGFLSSVGCINPCTSLPNEKEMIDYVPSRKRVIAIINDLKAFAGAGFPSRNGKEIVNAFVVVDGDPEFQD